MLPENSVFTFREPEKQLINSRQGYADGKLTPEVIDYEMQLPRDCTTLLLRGLTQDGLEYFVTKYGATYKTLYLDYCAYIKDFSPLEDLVDLNSIRIEWCKRTEHLWNLSKNTSLKILSIHDAKKLINNPTLLRTSSTLAQDPTQSQGGDFQLRSALKFTGKLQIRTQKRTIPKVLAVILKADTSH